MKAKPFAITLDPGSSLANKTGSWRTFRPVYVSRMPPCNDACPAGENIQKWLYYAEEKDYERAWRVLTEANPMPAVHGRVCYHPCEQACNRGRLDEAVNIHAVERFLGDHALEKGWRFPPGRDTGKKVLVIGGGPSGLAAAYHLRRLGHGVTIREAGPMLGGMMRFGIPKYRLPRDVLDAEIQRILDLGVEVELNHRVEDVVAEKERGGFAAVFLAIGAHLSKRVDIPAREAAKILDALSFLKEVATGGRPRIGRRVAVYGGGNTALDAARTAKRLGAEEAVIIYRRDEARMPAHREELQEAREEGILINWLRTIKHFEEDKIVVEEMELDADGFPRPTGKVDTIEADSLILALGQRTDTEFLRRVPGLRLKDDGVVEVDEHLRTGHPGLFAGGDMVPAERTVTVATGHGKRAAREIDAYLRGTVYEKPPRPPLAAFDRLNPWYYTDADPAHQPVLDAIRRRTTFEEVTGGLDESNALYEARRCLSCGNCFACDNCYGVCPDNAVVKLGPGRGYEFNYDYCKGCGLCAEECPCGAIDMVREEI